MWNLWLPKDTAEIAGVKGPGLTNLQYATICEIQGTSHPIEFAAEVCNCTSPDTGNMETIARYGNPDQKAQWLQPLLDGDIRSCFAMTEPDVASSDASNISIRIEKDEATDEYVINGSKCKSLQIQCFLLFVLQLLPLFLAHFFATFCHGASIPRVDHGRWERTVQGHDPDGQDVTEREESIQAAIDAFDADEHEGHRARATHDGCIQLLFESLSSFKRFT